MGTCGKATVKPVKQSGYGGGGVYNEPTCSPGAYKLSPLTGDKVKDCGKASSCWIVGLAECSTFSFDPAPGSSKVQDYFVENIETDWIQEGMSVISDQPGWNSVPETGYYRLIVNNWSDFSETDYTSLDGFGTSTFSGAIFAMDMWGKTYWDVTISGVTDLPTVIYNCENLLVPPTFTGSVTGALIPYIEAMTKSCPNVYGNGSLAECKKASDYSSAKKKYPEWFGEKKYSHKESYCDEYGCGEEDIKIECDKSNEGKAIAVDNGYKICSNEKWVFLPSEFYSRWAVDIDGRVC